MNSLSIFAGIDANENIRFVGDVPRGAECGCRCMACGAPLVARRGDRRTWHFAHEASQERPDCFAGAVNLLRRLAIEWLQEFGLPPIPVYRVVVSSRPPLPQLQETVEWDPGTGSVEQWEPRQSQKMSVGFLRLHTGSAVRIFVEVGATSAARLAFVPEHEGVLLLNVSLPSCSEDLKDLQAAIRHIANTSNLAWIRLPDVEARIGEVRQRLEEKARRVRDESQALWRMGGRTLPSTTVEPMAHQPKPPASASVVEPDGSPWSAWRKPRSAFLFYGLQDGSAWVLFTHKDGRHVMAPWPKLEEGWDESMPARIGSPDHQLGAYVLNDQLQAMIYLGGLRPRVQTASTWTELLAIKLRSGD